MWSRRNRTSAALAIAALLIAACTRTEASESTDVRDIRDTQPEDAEPDPAPEPDEPDDPEPDEPEPEPEDEPDPEPDTDGLVTVPESAFQINDDVDLDADAQRQHLEFVLDAYLYTTTALNTGEYDEDELRTYYAWDALESSLAGFEEYERDGLRQVNDGTVLEYLRIHTVDGAGIVIHQCVTDGPSDGVIDIETGEYTFEPEDPHWLVALHLALVEVEDDRYDWRIVDGGSGDDAAPCP